MRIYLGLLVCVLVGENALAANRAPATLAQRATDQVLETLGDDWKSTGNRCGSFKMNTSQYQYRCVVDVNKDGQGASYAVYFDRGASFVAMVRGSGKKTGKKISFNYGLKEALGFSELNEVSK